MTRINVVPVEELSDPHLRAETRELPRVIKGTFNLSIAPDKYCLGKGHVKWAKKYQIYILNRYVQLCKEMEYRGFKVNYPAMDLYNKWDNCGSEYFPDESDIHLNRQRLIEKYRMKPNWYKWTKREKPEWLNEK